MIAAGSVSSIGAFLGRFHPLWVHLPIGILVLLAVLEAVGWAARWPRLKWLPAVGTGQRTLVLLVGASAAVVTALLGWLLAHDGDYEAARVRSHQWLGIAAAAAAVLVFAVHRKRWLYAPLFATTLVLLVLAAHAGGTLTHGSGFLTAKMPPAIGRLLGLGNAPAFMTPVPVDFSRAAVFADVVQPILKDRCVGCHGPDKSNGGLRMDAWEQLAKGGKHGPVIGAADPAANPLVKRIDLPPEVKEHMPPAGKPQLTDDELTVLEWWVYAGAPREKPVASLELPASVAEAVRSRLGGAAPDVIPDRAAIFANAARLARELSILIRPTSPDGPWLDVNARVAGKAFGNKELALLSSIAPAIQWLDLGGTSVSDAGMACLAPMHRLERLHLDQCRITDFGLGLLTGLRRMEYLNLRGTSVSDGGIIGLRQLPRLRSLYVWQTAVTPAAVRSLGEALTDRRRIARLEAEQSELARQISAEQFQGNTGESLRPPAIKPPLTPP